MEAGPLKNTVRYTTGGLVICVMGLAVSVCWGLES